MATQGCNRPYTSRAQWSIDDMDMNWRPLTCVCHCCWAVTQCTQYVMLSDGRYYKYLHFTKNVKFCLLLWVCCSHCIYTNSASDGSISWLLLVGYNITLKLNFSRVKKLKSKGHIVATTDQNPDTLHSVPSGQTCVVIHMIPSHLVLMKFAVLAAWFLICNGDV